MKKVFGCILGIIALLLFIAGRVVLPIIVLVFAIDLLFLPLKLIKTIIKKIFD